MAAMDSSAGRDPRPPLRLKLVTSYGRPTALSDMAARTVVFTHIPKTAGTTLDHIMQAAALTRGATWRRARGTIYGPFPGTDRGEALASFEAIGREQLATIDYLTGHLPYGVHARMPRLCLYIALLRDPAARLLSHFLHGAWRGLWMRETPIEELIRARLLVDNPQTRQIAGLHDREEECTSATFAAALANLQSAYAVVGVTERFDEFLKELIGLLRWPDVAYSRHQVGRVVHDEDLLKLIAAAADRYCEFDRRLYEAAANRPLPWSADRFDGADGGTQRQGSVLVVSPSIRFGGRSYGLLAASEFDNALRPKVLKRGGSVAVV